MGLGPSSSTSSEKGDSPNSFEGKGHSDVERTSSGAPPLSIPQLKAQLSQDAPLTPQMHIVGSPPTLGTEDEHGADRTAADGGLGLSAPSVNTVLRWTNGGKEVFVSGTFNDWREKIAMRSSNNDFTTILNLPPGTYYYKYIVDGDWRVDPAKPTAPDMMGNLNNVLEVQHEDEDFSLMTPGSASPSGSYGQEMWDPSHVPSTPQKPGGPPALPPHLMRALLNTTSPDNDPSRLPLPHHVMLNHLYSLPRREDNVMIMGITQRYRQKFVTTVLYKALEMKEDLNNNMLQMDSI